ncbi:MAG: hypothetical protein ACLPX5_01020 [Dissulfurispiraceae bacterium]
MSKWLNSFEVLSDLPVSIVFDFSDGCFSTTLPCNLSPGLSV